MAKTNYKVGFDTINWRRKVRRLLRVIGPECAAVARQGSSWVAKSVDNNLKGDEYVPGQLPVRRITSTLRRSYRQRKISPYLFLHYFDEREAHYAKWVAFGTENMPPRDFFGAAMNENRQPIYELLEKKIQAKMRKIGRA